MTNVVCTVVVKKKKKKPTNSAFNYNRRKLLKPNNWK